MKLIQAWNKFLTKRAQGSSEPILPSRFAYVEHKTNGQVSTVHF